VIIPGSVNYFYDRAGERIAAALRGLGVTTELTTLAPSAAAPAEADRPIPWVLVGHQSAERAELAYRLVREAAPGGFVYLPRLSPVTESGPHLNGRQFAQVLSRARVQVWCSHHPHFYMESERFRDSLLSGSVPLKVVDRSPDPSRVFPFEYLVTRQADAPAWLRRTPYGHAWRRFREEFLALPSLEAGLAAFLGIDPRELKQTATTNHAPATETHATTRPPAVREGEGVLVEA
jgi:hypothetical protein